MEREPDGGFPPLEIDLQTMSRTAAIMTIIRAFLDDTITDERWFLDRLAERGQVDVDSEGLGRELFMTWDQVRQLADSSTGLTIGSHGHSHRKLAGLDDDAQYHELASSKQILEARLGRPIKALAYPYGWPGSLYRREPKLLAAQAGYHLAFSSRKGSTGSPGSIDMKSVGWGSARPTLRPCSGLEARSTAHSVNRFL